MVAGLVLPPPPAEAGMCRRGPLEPPRRGDGRAINLPAVVLATELEQEVSVINQGLSSYGKFIRQMNPRAQRAALQPPRPHERGDKVHSGD